MLAQEIVLGLAQQRGPRCGSVTVVAIDGPAGSGKTTLADAVHDRAQASGLRCVVVHMDDLYPGWTGLEQAGATVTSLLQAVAADEQASYRRYDWHAGTFADRVVIGETDLLLVEGVGSARIGYRELLSVLVWVAEPDPTRRRRRWLERDGEESAQHCEAWMVAEQRLFASTRARDWADVVVDGEGQVVWSSQ